MDKQPYQEFLPKYIIVYDWLIQEIENGNIKLGQKMPTEIELIKKFGINRSTVRAAMVKLERANMITRQRGKGTFLISAHAPQFVRSLQSFSSFKDDVHTGHPIEWRVLVAREDFATAELASKLHIPVGAPIHSLLRVGYSRNEPFVFESVKSTTCLIEELKKLDLTQNYYPLLSKQSKLVPVKLSFTLQAFAPDYSVGELLAITDNQPCIEVNSVTSDDVGNPLDVTKAIYRGDKYVFSGESIISV